MTDKVKKKPTLSKNGKVMGRPVGSRSKSSLFKAQQTFDDIAEEAAQTLIALARNDKKFLNTAADVPATIRLNACKVLLDKSIANEKEKLAEEKKEQKQKKGAAPTVTPKVFSSAK